MESSHGRAMGKGEGTWPPKNFEIPPLVIINFMNFLRCTPHPTPPTDAQTKRNFIYFIFFLPLSLNLPVHFSHSPSRAFLWLVGWYETSVKR